MAPERERTVVLRTVRPCSGRSFAFGQMPSSATLMWLFTRVTLVQDIGSNPSLLGKRSSP